MRAEPNRDGADQRVADWFVRRGVPSLLQGSGLPRLVGRRMVPALVLLYLLALVPYATNGPWMTLIDLAFAVGSLLLTWMLSNLARRRRPFARVDRLGVVELALFVLVPAALTASVSTLGVEVDALEADAAAAIRWETFVTTVVVQLVLLTVVWVLVEFGIWSLVSWLSRELFNSFEQIGTTIARTVPMLIGVVTFFSFTPRSGSRWDRCPRADTR